MSMQDNIIHETTYGVLCQYRIILSHGTTYNDFMSIQDTIIPWDYLRVFLCQYRIILSQNNCEK